MTSIPHSSDICSGLCLTPCGHAGCWQCDEAVVKAAEQAVKAQQVRAAKAITTLAAQRITPQPTKVRASASYSENQSVSITRAALQGLIDQVPDLSMDWNGGDPIVIRRQPNGHVGRKLNDVNGDWVAEGDVLAQAVAKIASSASASIDQMVRDAMKGPTPETLRISGIPGIHAQVSAAKAMQGEVERIMREKVAADERQAREVLKAQGASDEDIAAAADLLGWDPTKPHAFITADPLVQMQEVDITAIVNAWKPKRNPITFVSYHGIELKGEFIDVD